MIPTLPTRETPAHLISGRAGAAGAMFICSEQQNDEVLLPQLQ